LRGRVLRPIIARRCPLRGNLCWERGRKGRRRIDHRRRGIRALARVSLGHNHHIGEIAPGRAVPQAGSQPIERRTGSANRRGRNARWGQRRRFHVPWPNIKQPQASRAGQDDGNLQKDADCVSVGSSPSLEAGPKPHTTSIGGRLLIHKNTLTNCPLTKVRETRRCSWWPRDGPQGPWSPQPDRSPPPWAEKPSVGPSCAASATREPA
jgi:hypothetical protein